MKTPVYINRKERLQRRALQIGTAAQRSWVTEDADTPLSMCFARVYERGYRDAMADARKAISPTEITKTSFTSRIHAVGYCIKRFLRPLR
jgi:hypothetical protein